MAGTDVRVPGALEHPLSPVSMQSPPSQARRLVVALAFLGVTGYVVWRGNMGDAAPARTASGMRFEECAGSLGIAFTHRAPSVDEAVANIAAQITAVGAAVSVVDANGDGRPDLYAVTSDDGGLNALWMNRGDGRFEDAAGRAGLADVNQNGEGVSMGSVWADYDNDGDADCFLYRWGRGLLFRNDGDARFQDVTEGSGLDDWILSNGATWFDYDRDGKLDLFVGGYFSEEHDLWDLETTRIMQDSFEFSHNGGQNRIYRGNGDGTFVEVTEELGLEGTRWTYAAVAADLDRDGWCDLYLANDYGPEELWLNRGGESFELASDVGLEGESKSGMCAALGDLSGGERLSVFVTNISKRGLLFQGNNLRESFVHRGGPMMQVASGPIVDCGWAWGAQFGDLDNDGDQDLVVVNGFISASRDRDYWYQMTKIGQATGDVIADAARWPAFEDRSLSGYERTHLFENLGLRGAHFREVGEATGVDDVHDGRAVAVADLFGDGTLDLIVANQGGPLLVYRNRTDARNHWLELDLVGTVSNRDALGAEVVLERGDERQLRVVTAASGFAAQNERRVHFGLGGDAAPVTLRIRWPSGREQVLEGVATDRVHVVEEPR